MGQLTQQRLMGSKYFTLKEFPSKCIQINPQRFKATKRDLQDQSEVPKELIAAWELRQKVAAQKASEKEKEAKTKSVPKVEKKQETKLPTEEKKENVQVEKVDEIKTTKEESIE